MPEKDMTGRAVDTAAQILSGAKNRIATMIPLGPRQIQMQPKELQDALRGAQPGTLKAIMDQLGPELALKMLLGVQDSSGQSPVSIDDFLEER